MNTRCLCIYVFILSVFCTFLCMSFTYLLQCIILFFWCYCKCNCLFNFFCERSSRGHWEEVLFIYLFIYLLLERWEGRKRERNINAWLPPMRSPHWGPGPKPRHVPWLGIEPATPRLAACAQSTKLLHPGQVSLSCWYLWHTQVLHFN